MVLKNFIHYLINKYLKNYVERLDYEKLNFSLKNGNVVLENLRLKPEALAYLNIPVTVAVGYIEQLKLTIPWKNLSTKPTEVQIDGFYLLIVSKNELSQDLHEHYAEKMLRVQQKVDNLRKAALESGKFDKKETDFIQRMRFLIKQNLIFKIRNFHICHERASSAKLGHPFSFGITLHYLELISTNSVKSTKDIKGDKLPTYEIKEINSLSFYWNTKCKSRLNVPFEVVLNDLKSKIATNDYRPNDEYINYILPPVNLLVESMIVLKPKEHQYERSKLMCNIQIEELNLYINPKQISDVLDFVKFQNYTKIYDRCREYHELLRQYSLDMTSLTEEQKGRLEFLERKLDIFNLAYIRHKLEMEMYFIPSIAEDNSLYQQEQQMEINQGPIDHLTTETNNNNNRSHHRWNKLAKMKNKFHSLNKVFDHFKSATATTIINQSDEQLYFEDLPKFAVEMKLKKVKLNLLSTSNNTKSINIEETNDIITQISITDASVNFKRMSVSSRIECLIDLQSIEIFGIGHNKDDRSASLMKMLPSSSPDIHIEFELFPQDQKSDYRFHLILQPLKFIYDAPTISRVVESFEQNGLIIWPLKRPIKRRTTIEMQEELPYKKVFDMTIHFKGLSFVLPEYGVYQENFSIIRIDFDEFILKSCLDDNPDETNDNLFQEKLEDRQFYTKYKLELNDLRIIYSTPNKNRLHLLRRIPSIDIDFYKCLYSDDADLTKWRIALKTIIGEICLSKNVLTKLIDHLNSIPLLYSNISSIIKRINFYFVIFSPHTSWIVDISIFNCYLRLLMYPQKSIKTDVRMNISKKRDKQLINTNTVIILDEPSMILNTSFASTPSSFIFYRNDRIKLIYSSVAEKP